MVSAMHLLAVGFWGAFFGAVALMLAGALAAFVQSHHRVALLAALSSLVSAAFVAAYLGFLPFRDPIVEIRFLAHVGILTAVVLGLLLLTELGLLQEPDTRRKVRGRMLAVAGLTVGAGWLLDAREALEISSLVSFIIGIVGLMVGIRSGRRGDRLAWIAVGGVAFMLVALAGLSWIALERAGLPWPVHAVSAVAATAYLTCLAAMLWKRYSYLIELREVLAQGPRYDPVTRMQSNAATGHMVNIAFMRQQQHPGRPLVLIAISIGNLYALENLHGRAALNHALFVCAGRLRRCVPGDIEMARLFDDGFLLVARDATDMDRLVKLGRAVAERLSRPVTLTTSADATAAGSGRTQWAAQVGVGLLATAASGNPSAAVAMARDMSRTAWTFASRIAWHDQALDRIAELPAFEAR
jgi:GGDEF domain-containing protein